MNSNCVDLVYLDPPFNSKANYAAPIGSEAAGAEFKDTWTLSDVDVEWINFMESKHPNLHRVLLAAMTPSNKAYLSYMAVRLLEIKRLLKSTGSIYVHCDQNMGHYLKLLLDAIFGQRYFRNEVIWSYQRWTGSTKHFQRMHDTIFFYAMSDTSNFNQLKEPYSEKSKHKGGRISEFKNGKIVQRYTEDNTRLKSMRDVWEISYLNSQAKERTGYPTQKPLALLRRIILASSNNGDMVLDPFCGCATTCIAAEIEGRQWAGIDISPQAALLVEQRMRNEVGIFFNGAVRTDIPLRTDLGNIPKYNSKRNKESLYGIQEGNCAGCQIHFRIQHLEIDHIISRQRGGTDHIENLQLLCSSCNRIKGNRGMEYLRAKLQI